MPQLEISIADYIRNRMFLTESSRLELQDRLENICERPYPMTDDLTKDIRNYLGDEKLSLQLIQIIEAYPTLEKPVLPNDLKKRLEAKLPRELYLPFLRIFDRACCPVIDPRDFAYNPFSWDFGVALFITASIPDQFTAYFEYTEDEGQSWIGGGLLSDGQLSGNEPIPITSPAFWSRLQVVSDTNCIYYSEISTITTA